MSAIIIEHSIIANYFDVFSGSSCTTHHHATFFFEDSSALGVFDSYKQDASYFISITITIKHTSASGRLLLSVQVTDTLQRQKQHKSISETTLLLSRDLRPLIADDNPTVYLIGKADHVSVVAAGWRMTSNTLWHVFRMLLEPTQTTWIKYDNNFIAKSDK
uniref:Cadherin domain-containing protein n=1 Tax=Ascaris lumbricoides TaxID=6252 RepID=A0A9J2NSK3_ASCLU